MVLMKEILSISLFERYVVAMLRDMMKHGHGHIVLTFQNGRCVHCEKAEKIPPDELKKFQEAH